jgi:hypothetical protein
VSDLYLQLLISTHPAALTTEDNGGSSNIHLWLNAIPRSNHYGEDGASCLNSSKRTKMYCCCSASESFHACVWRFFMTTLGTALPIHLRSVFQMHRLLLAALSPDGCLSILLALLLSLLSLSFLTFLSFLSFLSFHYWILLLGFPGRLASACAGLVYKIRRPARETRSFCVTGRTRA